MARCIFRNLWVTLENTVLLLIVLVVLLTLTTQNETCGGPETKSCRMDMRIKK